jgi:alpha-L-fucosidase 2
MVEHLPKNVRVGVVNVSVAGCKIELFDKDNYQTYAATAPGWMTNMIKEYGGNPYRHLVDMAKLAQNDGVIKGILLHQGESNTNDKQWPEKVKKIYDNLLKDLDLKPDSVPLLTGELVNADQNGACASMNTIIAQLPKTIPNAYVISSAGCPCATPCRCYPSWVKKLRRPRSPRPPKPGKVSISSSYSSSTLRCSQFFGGIK